MPTNYATLPLAQAYTQVGHIVEQSDQTYTSYSPSEFYRLPKHACYQDFFVACGQSNVGTGWTNKLDTGLTAARRNTIIDVLSHGGTSITLWQPGGTYYNEVIALARARTGLRGIIFYLGETNAIEDMATAAFQAYLSTIAGGFFSDLGVKTMPFKIGNMVGYDETKVNTAIGNLWSGDSNVVTGADLSDMVPSNADGIHFTTDAEWQTIADRAQVAVVNAGW